MNKPRYSKDTLEQTVKMYLNETEDLSLQTFVDYIREHSLPNYTTFYRYLDVMSWSALLNKYGFKRENRSSISTPEEYDKAFRAFLQQSENPSIVEFNHYAKSHNLPSVTTFLKHLGQNKWTDLIRTYGNDSHRFKNYTKDEFIELFKTEYTRIMPSSSTEFNAKTSSYKAQSFARRTGMSYSELVEYCGFQSGKIHHPEFNYYEDYDEAFKLYLEQTDNPTASDFTNYINKNNLPSILTFVKYLRQKSWQDLKEAYGAGMKSSSYSKEEMIDLFRTEYVRIHPKNSREYDKKTTGLSTQTLIRWTGLSYKELIEVSGFKDSSLWISTNHTMEEYDAAFRTYLSQTGLPSISDFNTYTKSRNLPAAFTFIRHLGYTTWNELLIAYGIEPYRIHSKAASKSKEKCVPLHESLSYEDYKKAFIEYLSHTDNPGMIDFKDYVKAHRLPTVKMFIKHLGYSTWNELLNSVGILRYTEGTYTTDELIELFKNEYKRIQPKNIDEFDNNTKWFSARTFSYSTGMTYSELVSLCGLKPKRKDIFQYPRRL